MTLYKYKLGELITQRREKNLDSNLPICGVSKDGLIPPKQQYADISIYNVFYRNDFIFNPARMELNSIAYNDSFDKAICSSLYEVFYVHRTDLIKPEYLKLIVKQKWFTRYCEFLGQGSAREYCRFANISEIEIEFPDIEKQEQIVKADSVIGKRISLLHKINDNLEAQILCIFTERFGSVIKSRKNLPADWIADEAQNIYEIAIGKTPPRERLDCFTTDASDTKWVSISDMGTNGMYIHNTAECLTPLAIKEFNVKKVPANSVIYSFKMTNGRTSITTEECTTNEAIAHFKSKDINLIYYAYCYLSTFRFSDLGSTSSITEAVNSKIIKAMPFYIPPYDDLSAFVDTVKPMFETIKLNSSELDSLNNIAKNCLALLSR